MTNPFDQFDTPEPVKPPLKGVNPFDQFDPPAQPPGATGANRLQAAEGGVLSGSAYLAALPADAVANLFSLGKMAGGAPFLMAGKVPPKWLQIRNDASPVGGWLTRQMDKSPITTTQPERPDDPASRYLSAGASVIPGALSGGGGLAQTAKVAASAVPAALGGQYLSESKPFGENESANRAAALLGQAALGFAAPRGKGPAIPGRSGENIKIQEAQDRGMVFPPATVNPTSVNRTVEGIAGKRVVEQRSQLINQPAANRAGRADMNLPQSDGPIEPHELAMAKGQAQQGYDAVRSAGALQVPPTFRADLQSAMANNSAIKAAVPALGNKSLETIVNQLSNNKTLDSNTVLAINAKIRDLKSEAYRNGRASEGKDYGAVSKVLEDAIEYGLTQKQVSNAPDLLKGYRASRQTFARIGTVEEALHPSGNIDATKLSRAAAKAPGKITGELGIVADAAGLAPKAFFVPAHSAGVDHSATIGAMLVGLGALGEHTPAGAMGWGPLIAAGAYKGSRIGAMKYALGPGQNNLIPRSRAAMNAATAAALLSSGSATEARNP